MFTNFRILLRFFESLLLSLGVILAKLKDDLRWHNKGDWLEPSECIRDGEIFAAKQQSTKMVCFC
ncbi:MAG: hypothetical protein ACJAXZ_004499 [Akkermansiaceae bacterium]|jgi:hypothetical protein